MIARKTIAPSVFFSIAICWFLFLSNPPSIFASDTTSPETTHTFTGTFGNNGWYTSTVGVTLSVTDLEAGPESTTYWLNSQDPITYSYTTGQNQVLNPSFEEGYLLRTIYNWEHVPDPWLFFWRTYLEHKFGFRSAATGLFGTGTYYWYNRSSAVPVTSGQTYTASGWVKTIELWGEAGGWFEVWAKGAGNMTTDIKIAESVERIRGETDWRMLTRTFVVPEGYSSIYLRLCTQDTGFLGVSFWDGISIHGGYEYTVNFTVVENGAHSFHYYSTDNSGNIEGTHTTGLKIDTVAPQDWGNFDQTKEGNDHTFKGSIEVRDVTSGVDTATAQYAYYTDQNDSNGLPQEWDHNGDGEKDWYSVASIKRVDTGLPAVDSYTGFVELETPTVDFGNSATIMKMQFRISDMAGNLSDSPVQMILGPWIKAEGNGTIAANGNIVMQTAPPEGNYNADSLILIGGLSTTNFTSSQPWKAANYPLGEKSGLADYIEKYEIVRDQAQLLPNNRLPTVSGIYYYTGNYTIDGNSMPLGFINNTFSSIVIIEGNLTIKNDYLIQPNTTVLFLVTGNIYIWGQVKEISGFFISGGNIDTNINLQGKDTLNIYGSVAACQNLLFNRDLGRKGLINNENTPAEYLHFQPKYVFDPFFLKYLGTGTVEINWMETVSDDN